MSKNRKAYYMKVSTVVNDRIEIEKHYDGRFGAPGVKREPKRKRTPEEMAKQNLWRKLRDLRRLIELNFKGGDWHVVLTCRKDLRPDLEEAPAVIREFRDKLRKAYRQQNWDLKYIITCETGERGAVHWHMIVNDMASEQTTTCKLISKFWERGRPHFTALDENRDYKDLAEYIVKETSKRIEEGKTIEKLSYMPSRNLKKPDIRREKVPARIWRKEPKAPPGYMVIPESVVNGYNKFTGWPYQYYSIKRIDRKERAG